MKAFLSHSSKDKAFVSSVAEQLRPGTYELDSLTFDSGLLNSQAIVEALRRSTLFCLFLSKHSVKSSYVHFETLVGSELLASGQISRLVILCLDDEAFESAPANIKLFNIVRRRYEPSSAARLIQGLLVASDALRSRATHPFIGREEELLELEKQVTDLQRPPPKSLFVSGYFGSGRRAVAQTFYSNQYPNVGHIMPQVDIDEYSGLDEIYRKVLATLRPSMRARDFVTHIQAFSLASDTEKPRLISQLINSVLSANEAVVLFDQNGVLLDSGYLSPEIDAIVGHLHDSPHPPAIFISPRMIPLSRRRRENDIAYLALTSLSRDASERLVRRLLRDHRIAASDEALQDLTRLSDGHPFNMYRMIDEVRSSGLEPFLANPKDFIDWKHRHSSEYLLSIELSNVEVGILGLLKTVPELDFEGMVEAQSLPESEVSDALRRLIDLHVLEFEGERFMISPPLKIAVERDGRISLSATRRAAVLEVLARTLSIRIEEGTATIALVDSALISKLERGDLQSEFVSAFLLPSHMVLMAKRQYDSQNWSESMRFASEALDGSDRLSRKAFVAACRYLCLAGSRLGDEASFEEGIRRLARIAGDDWAKSNVSFLRGFNLRLKGRLPEAESHLREAYELTPGNISAAREIASICLVRENFDDAEKFSREAYNYAPTNPFIIDILIATLIRKYGNDVMHEGEIDELLNKLERVGDEGGRSFYTTRRAEFEHRCGDNRKALALINEAVQRTPKLFEPKKLKAEILMKERDLPAVWKVIREIRGMVSAGDPYQRRTNYRAYLEIHAEYLVEMGAYDEAKELFSDERVFTIEEREKSIRSIEVAEGYKKLGN